MSHCSVVAAAELESVSLDATCSGYMDLTYLIHFSGKLSNATRLSGDWKVSAAGILLDSGTFSLDSGTFSATRPGS